MATTECGREMLRLNLRLMLMPCGMDTTTISMGILDTMATTECGRGMLNLRPMLMLNTTTPDTTTAILINSTTTIGIEIGMETNGTTNGDFDCLRIDQFCL